MSRSTNASPGAPDDDEGRLADGSTEPTDDVAADAAADADEAGTADGDAVADEPGGSEDSDDAGRDDDAVPATAAAVARSREAARERKQAARSGGKPAVRPAARPAARAGKDERRGPIAAIVLFVRQVISELRKVVTPTGKELGTYVAVVIVFVLVVMAYVGVLDFAIGRLVLWAFGG